MIAHRKFRAHELVLFASAPPPDRPPLSVGERCRLTSGGPSLLIVDVDGDALVVSWRDPNGIVHEHAFARGCLRRSAGRAR